MHSYGQSEWTLEAFRRREESRHSDELSYNKRLSNASSSDILRPVLTSDWTLAAFQKREKERLRLLQSKPLENNPPNENPIFLRSISQQNLTPVLPSDWSLKAFHAREEKRKRDEIILRRTKDKSDETMSIVQGSIVSEKNQPNFPDNRFTANSVAQARTDSSLAIVNAQSAPIIVSGVEKEITKSSTKATIHEHNKPVLQDEKKEHNPVGRRDFSIQNNNLETEFGTKDRSFITETIPPVIENISYLNKDIRQNSGRRDVSVNKRDNASSASAGTWSKKIIVMMVSGLLGFILGYVKNHH